VDCEGCGRYHDEAELGQATCSVCGTPTTARPLRRALLRLEPLRAWLDAYLSTIAMGPPVRRFARTVLARPLPDVAVTAPGEGIPVPDPRFAGHRLYPAFELAGRYVVMARRLRRSGRFAPEEATATALLFGFDNAFERVVLFPVVLRALGDQTAPAPTVMQMTYFYLLEGAKFSTSRQHFVLARDLIAEAGADAVRLYVAATRPEHERTSFSRASFERSEEAQVVAALARWAETRTPPESGWATVVTPEAHWSVLAAAVPTLRDALRPATFSCREAAGCVVDIARVALAAAGHAARGREGWSDLAAAAREALVTDCEPLIPGTARSLRAALGVRPSPAPERLAQLAAGPSRARSPTV
jgi:methionyl-tRNA synthetase